MGQLPLLKQILKHAPVQRVVHRGVEPRAYLGLVTVAYGVEQQFPQRPPFELQFPEHVEDLAAKVCRACSSFSNSLR